MVEDATEMSDAAWRRVSETIAKAPPKPAFGLPCNGCGFCCAAEPCGIAQRHIPGCNSDGQCSAMEFEDGRYWCGMVRRPGHYLGLPGDAADAMIGATVAEALGVGRGCCSDFG